MRKPFGYSIHMIHPNGSPVPKGFRRSPRRANTLAEEIAETTGHAVEVWDVRQAKRVRAIPAREVAHAAHA